MDASPDSSAAYYYVSTVIGLIIVLAIPYQYSQIKCLLQRRKRQINNNLNEKLKAIAEEILEENEEGIDIAPIHSFITVWFHKIWNTTIHVTSVGDMSVGEIILLFVFIFFNLFFFLHPFQTSNANFPTNLNNRAGRIGVANAAFIFPLASRNSIFLTFLGIPFERIIKFHRWVGRMIIFCIMFHGMGHIQEGYEAGGNLTAAIFGSTVLFVIANIFHVSENFYFEIIGILLYSIDVSIRFYLSKKNAKIIKLETIQNDITKITIKYNMFYEAGQYIFVYFPNLKKPLSSTLIIWHPVSISSSPTSLLSLNNNISTIHLKKVGKFTNSLFDRAIRETDVINPTLNISIEGPYGKSSVQFMDYETVMLFSGGIGITPMISILRSLVDRLVSGMAIATTTIYFIWVIPNFDSYNWFSSEIQEIQEVFNNSLKKSNNDNKYMLDIKIFVTKPIPNDNNTNSSSDSALSKISHIGRPKFEGIMQDVKRYHGSGDVAVGACGPSLMLKDITNAAMSQSTRKGLFLVHTEIFEL
ncbi:7172_t:CDS:2 [Entrophospora sp. SA101]|nr:7172_t:CDS:2 [Entrophospora sp. SA101]